MSILELLVYFALYYLVNRGIGILYLAILILREIRDL